MDENKWGLYGLIIGIIEFNLNLILYIFFKSINILMWVILGSAAVIVLAIITDKFNKIEENSDKINKLTEKLKRAEELVDIRADIKYLKNKLR